MNQKTILLVCSAGMSTSLLVTKMQKAAEAKELDRKIFAISASEIDGVLAGEEINVLLLGPQVRFMEKQMKEKLSDKNVPCEVINMTDYGMMNGEKVLAQAEKLMG